MRDRTMHDFSLHLMPPLNFPNAKSNAYVSVAQTKEVFDDGKRIAALGKLYIHNPYYDHLNKIFMGTVHLPRQYKSCSKIDYKLKFSEDLKQVLAGSITYKTLQGVNCGVVELELGDYILFE